jgi:hypothetical protein
MSKGTPADDPRQKTDGGSLKQTDKPWKGAPEKEPKPGEHAPDLEKGRRPTCINGDGDGGKQTGRRQRAQGRAQEAHPAEGKARWCDGLDQAQQDLRRVHGGEKARGKKRPPRSSRACGESGDQW